MTHFHNYKEQHNSQHKILLGNPEMTSKLKLSKKKNNKYSPDLEKIKINCRVDCREREREQSWRLIIKQCKVFQRFNTNLLAIQTTSLAKVTR